MDQLMKMIPGMANNPAMANASMDPKDMATSKPLSIPWRNRNERIQTS